MMWLRELERWLGARPAQAGIRLVSRGSADDLRDQAYLACHNLGRLGTLTNGEVAAALSGNHKLAILNELIQRKMDQARELMRRRVHQRLPQCEITFLELPQIFAGGAPVETDAPAGAPLEQRYALPEGTMTSVLPNGANALSVRDTVMVPHPHNSVFAEDTRAQYQRLGIRPAFIDTFDYAHVGDGNLHCSTHAIPFCRSGRR
jgi:hypothetical protein